MASRIKGITIEIDGNTTKLQNSLKDVDKTLSGTRRELSDLDKALKLDPNSLSLLVEKQKELETAISATKERLQILNDAAAGLDLNSEEYAAVSREISITEASLKSLEDKSAQTATQIDDLSNSADDAGDEVKELGEDAKKSGKDADDAEKDYSKLGETLSTVAKAAGAAIAAVGAAAFAFGKQVVESYSEFEQLSGGVNKLFSNADEITAYANELDAVGYSMGMIAEEVAQIPNAADIAMKNAARAYETAGLSANQYMETVTSFSAGLISSLEGDTVTAAQVADMAIIDMADNANTFGTSVESLQTAYAGFAKGNYSMLDNLSLGFAGSKEGMEQLLAKAEEFSGIHYDISSLSDVYEAIHVVQNEMGIAGATAKEAKTTIEGSFNALSASVANLVTGFGDADANLEELVGNVAENAMNVVANVTPIIENIIAALPTVFDSLMVVMQTMMPTILSTAVQLFSQILTALIGLIPQLIPAAVKLITTFTTTIVQNLPMLISSGIELIKGLISGMGQAIPQIVAMLPEIIKTITTTLIENTPEIVESGIELLEGLIEGIVEAIPELVEMLPDVIDSIITTLINMIPLLVDAGVKLLTSLANDMPRILKQITAQLPTIITGIINGLVAMIPELIDAGVTLLVALVENTPAIVTGLVNAIPDIIGGLITGILNAIPQIIETGKTLIESLKEGFGEVDLAAWFSGIWEDIKSGAEEVWTNITGWATKIKEAFTNLTSGIHINLPHFTMSGKFSISPLQVPKIGIDWYAKAMNEGMILNDATIFGMAGNNLLAGGEAGAEAVVGVSSLRSMIQDAVGVGNGMTVNMVINGAQGQDVHALAKIVEEDLYRTIQSRKEVFA